MNQDLMGFFSRNNLPKSNFMEKIKDGAYIINIDQYTNVSTHWIALFCKKKLKFFISIVLVLNISLKKLKLTFFEYKKSKVSIQFNNVWMLFHRIY